MNELLKLDSTIKDCFQWDVGNWKKAMATWEVVLDKKQYAKCLDIGSRDGGLSLYLSLHGYEVICSDLEKPGDSANNLHQRYHVDHLIQYEAIDALHIPYTSKFDIIIFKSVLGGIGRNGQSENQSMALDQMFKALKPGGVLLFAENLAASKFHAFMRRKFMRWGSYWNYPTEKSMKEMLLPHGNLTFKTTGFAGAFGRSERQRNFLALFDKFLFNHITPSSWQYISFGYVIKK